VLGLPQQDKMKWAAGNPFIYFDLITNAYQAVSYSTHVLWLCDPKWIIHISGNWQLTI